MKKKHKPGSMGQAFHTYLEWLEYVESVLVSGKNRVNGRKYMALNDRLFHVEDERALEKVMLDAAPVDAALARIVRSSVKYRMSFDTMRHLSENYMDGLKYIHHNYPVQLPHEWSTVVFEGAEQSVEGADKLVVDDIILVPQLAKVDTKVPYKELELDIGDEFICVNIAFHRNTGVELIGGGKDLGQRLSYCPVELHMVPGSPGVSTKTTLAVAGDGAVEVTDAGLKALDLAKMCFNVWLYQFQLQSILRHKQPGVAAMPGKGYQRKRLRKRHEHPQFEHTIIQMEVDAPDSQQTGRSVFQPRKRLHQVRGFWRHMRKTGKKVWVKPHWRGDEHLGVVRRDIELVMHEGESNEQQDVNYPPQG